MDAAAQHVSSVSAPVNTTPAWTVEGLRRALRALDSGRQSTMREAARYLHGLGLSHSEACERAYGLPGQPSEPSVRSLLEVATVAASFACLWQDGPDGMDCREAIPCEPDGWCPMCLAREALGQ